MNSSAANAMNGIPLPKQFDGNNLASFKPGFLHYVQALFPLVHALLVQRQLPSKNPHHPKCIYRSVPEEVEETDSDEEDTGEEEDQSQDEDTGPEADG